jgi:brefeldin A-inhibited guanine nucleotide-exchange protein
MACRNKADRYCKDTRHPVCSYECKNKHVSLVE